MLTRVVISFSVIISVLACEQAPLLTELERRARNYVANGTTEPFVNDIILGQQWYSVFKYDEQYLMPDSTNMPDYYVCGGHEPIYIKGTHPDVTSLTTTPVDAKACLKNPFSNCDIEYNIKIRRCSNGEIQYYLVGTKLFASYCFDPPYIQNETSNFSDPPSDVELGRVLVNPILDFESKTVEGTDIFAPFVKFECRFVPQMQYFYVVNWYLNGALYRVLGPSDDVKDLLITEKTMHGRDKISLGFTLKCGVRVLKDKTGRPTVMVFSQDYFAGIKILNPRVDILKTENATVKFKLTVPFGCRYTTSQSPVCFMELNMFDPDGYKCNEANVFTVKDSQKCGLNINGLKSGDLWNFDEVYNFTIETGFETYNDKSDFTLQLAVTSHDHEWWNTYQPDNIQVVVSDNNLYKDKTCYAHVDPHMQTADGYNYECQEKGEYLMYRNTKYQIEVLMKTDACNNGAAQCVCNVMIRAGADVFSINLCQKPKFIEFLSCADGGILRVVNRNEKSYQVYTPIATYIDIYIHGPGTYFGFMNVDIHMSPKDVDNVEGLCGYMDDNQTNDLMTRNKDILPRLEGYIYNRHHPEFIRNWRLKDDENLFNGIKHLSHWKDINAMYCVCEQAISGSNLTSERVPKALCSATQYLDCNLTRPTVTSRKCNKISIINKKRRRRTGRVTYAYDKQIREAERLLRLAKIPRGEAHHVKRRSASERNITESEARFFCGRAIDGSPVMSYIPESLPGNGSEAVIDQCIFDVIAGNDLGLADVHIDAINTIAKAKLKLDPVYVTNNTAEVEIFKKNSCPANCSQKGKCSGECECDQYFYGSDCSIDERDPVVIDDLEGGGLCNLTDGDGCECFYFRTNNLLSNFSCSVSGKVMYTDGTEENITTSLGHGEYEDIFTGLCCVPRTKSKRSVEENFVFSRRYDISVSNNGQNYGAAESLYVYDSECQDAIPAVGKGYRILLKDGYCLIDGMCISNKENSVSDDCFTCDPSTSAYKWTQRCEQRNSDNDRLGVILGTTISSIAIVLAVIGVWYCKIKPKCKTRLSVSDSIIYRTEPPKPMANKYRPPDLAFFNY